MTRADRLARAFSLADDVRGFRFCGPSDDPDEISAVTFSFRGLATQFAWAASRLDDPEIREIAKAINPQIGDNIYEAYELNDALIPVLGRLDELRQADGGIVSRTLAEILRDGDLESVTEEFERTLAMAESDPAGGLTAACSIVESMCKTYLDDNNIARPNDESVKHVWKAVASHIGFDPAALEDDDLKRILRGLSSVVDGLGSLRTHAGTAHGRGRLKYRVRPRHARLAINSAHTLVTFLIETQRERLTPGQAK